MLTGLIMYSKPLTGREDIITYYCVRLHIIGQLSEDCRGSLSRHALHAIAWTMPVQNLTFSREQERKGPSLKLPR